MSNQTMTKVVEGLSTYVEGRVRQVVFDRPHHRNALNFAMWKAIPGLMEEATNDDEIRAIAFVGRTGEVFSAGADIQEFETARAGVENATLYSDAVREAELSIINSSKPTLAFVRGWCVGGGCEIAVACDIRVGDPSARMGLTPVKLGIVYGQVSTSRLVQEVGPAWARYLLLTGLIVNSSTALRSSLLHEIYPRETAEQDWDSLLATVTAGAPITQAAAKKLVDRAIDGTGAEDDLAAHLYQRSHESTEYNRGVKSFITKQTPSFTDVPWPLNL